LGLRFSSGDRCCSNSLYIHFPNNPAGIKIAFLARHGKGHYLNPSEVNSRANIAALKHVGCKVKLNFVYYQVILSFSAVGSLREEIAPQHFVVPSQIIDRTKGIRASTFFEGGLVAHTSFADPFDASLRELVFKLGSESDITFHKDKTLVCMYALLC
jgi:5'-methylthioadenosine phosphorylase